ncbi:MAG TPA: adenine-specific methyltransferase EcoRI family protein [Brevefilum sp.]|nr:adenine-specific methyltransferase EcoRI family protein [Brevefilum sp.]HOR19515.1 adenine-specific methyltransferase EcoRI family protein [Brevefilum sp.]HPL69156.1 adenine-specific methyltransferase EcoRI family protein [Brevefilum sp.]
MATENLDRAKKNKADEFYTQMPDIEAELRHYKKHFRGKVVLCNCDDPFESNFFKYFATNFNHLGLKKLIATSYSDSPVAYQQLPLFEVNHLEIKNSAERPASKIEINEVKDENKNGAIDLADVEYLIRNRKNTLTLLEGDGDFRSEECIQLLKEADIVVTNPPFSLFREYVAQLVEYDKNFIIIGSKNAITYKEIFALIKEDKLWLGNEFRNGNAYFRIPTEYAREWADGVFNPETGLVKFRNVGWFTNLDLNKRHEIITLYKNYSPEEYPHYDNYDAINVDRVAEIPYDYDGAMGVPITFLDKYNPEQFNLIGIDRYVDDNPNYGKRFSINGKEKYARILIRKKRPQDESRIA